MLTPNPPSSAAGVVELVTTCPRVSVIIPAYNVAAFIRETLASVFNQTFADYEIILINDGSPDTEELERAIQPYSGRLVYLKQSNQGAGAARNAGLRVARGEFAAFLDGDDLWLPEFLEQQLKLIESERGFELVYADAVNLHDAGVERLTNMDVNPSAGPVTMASLISGRCTVITSCVVARRQMILDVGLFDEGFPNSQDFDLWLRLVKHGARLNYQKVVLAQRRVYAGSLASNPFKSLGGEIKVLEKTAQRTDLTTEERNAIVKSLERCRATVAVFQGKETLATGDFKASRASFQLANRYYRSWKLRLVLWSLRLAPRLLQRAYRLRTT
jgi:glycosyltransferase involved in cell wall biosynthesis